VAGPEITYEKRGGTDNFKAIMRNVQKSVPKGKSSNKDSGTSGAEKKLIINDFIVKNGKVNLAVALPGGGFADQEIKTDLPDIHIKDIGRKKGGASAAEVAKEIFAALYGKVTSPDVLASLDSQFKNLGGAGIGKITEAVKTAPGVAEDTAKKAEGAADKVKGLFKKKD
jgi:hypothetical protein